MQGNFKIKPAVKKFTFTDYMTLAILLVVGIGLIGYPFAYRGSKDATSFTVKRLVENGGKYLIFTENGEVFENSDTILHGKWDSSDLQAELEAGHTYQADIAGWRIQCLSMYRNVLDVTDVTDKIK